MFIGSDWTILNDKNQQCNVFRYCERLIYALLVLTIFAGEINAEPAPKKDTRAPTREKTKIAAFVVEDCPDCRRVKKLIELCGEQSAQYLEVLYYNLNDASAFRYNMMLCRKLDIESDNRGKAPAVFSGSRGLVRRQITEDALQQLILSASPEGSVVRPEDTFPNLQAVQRRRFPAAPHPIPDTNSMHSGSGSRDCPDMTLMYSLGVLLGLCFASLVLYVKHLKPQEDSA